MRRGSTGIARARCFASDWQKRWLGTAVAVAAMVGTWALVWTEEPQAIRGPDYHRSVVQENTLSGALSATYELNRRVSIRAATAGAEEPYAPIATFQCRPGERPYLH